MHQRFYCYSDSYRDLETLLLYHIESNLYNLIWSAVIYYI